MAIHKLTTRKVETAKPGKHEDGGGLRLVVSPAGSRRWVLRFTLHGRRRGMGLGGFPDVSLAEARSDALKYRKMVRAGEIPIQARKVEARSVRTFTHYAARYVRDHRHGWKNRKHGRRWLSTLKAYARPIIGKKTVDTITTDDILEILKPLWTTKTETATRVQGRIASILDFAAVHERDNPNFDHAKWRNPATWRGHLDKLLSKPSKVKKVEHHPAMDYRHAGAFMAELADRDGISALALRFLVLTATRTNEVLGALWEEFDLEAGVWTIPAERMKAEKEHRVPLTAQALAVLEAVPRMAGNPHVFPGTRRGRPLSNVAMLQLMRGMGYGKEGPRQHCVPHGFRSSFRDWAGEVSTFPTHVAEMALAHAIKDKTEAAYRRGDLFEKRRKMMEAWERYLSAPAGEVVALSLGIPSYF